MKVSSNMTISQLISKGEEQIQSQFEPESNELVGFGKHGDMTYAQVMEQHPSYIQWVITTARESDSPHWRLKRLAQWSSQQRSSQAVNRSSKTQAGNTKGSSSVGSCSMVDPIDISTPPSSKGYKEQDVQKELAQIETMKQELAEKMKAVQDKEIALEVEKAELSYPSGRHKNRKET